MTKSIQTSQTILPQEKIKLKGPESLEDYELLALILRSGDKHNNVLEISQRILAKDPLSQLFDVPMSQLVKRKGIGVVRAAQICAINEIAKRIHGSSQKVSIHSPEDAYKIVSFIHHKKREYFVALYLNARQEVLNMHTVSIGSVDMSLVHPREVFEQAILHSASSVIITHNHPSGHSSPSDADLKLTIRLKKAGEILGIKIIDHVIACPHEHFSFKRENLL